MPTNAILLAPPPNNWGGPRPGAGRKSTWPADTAIKTMRFPAVLEDELRQYAHQRMTELQRAQARADDRKAAGPPPELKHVHMEKIDARHFTIVHDKRCIGDVGRSDGGRWLACLRWVEGDQAYAWCQRQCDVGPADLYWYAMSSSCVRRSFFLTACGIPHRKGSV